MMRQLLVFALARVKNLRVTEADDGVDGLRKLASARYDIIVTDINMPIMDGLKLVKRVRSDPVHKDTPIVIITTEGSQEDRSARSSSARTPTSRSPSRRLKSSRPSKSCSTSSSCPPDGPKLWP